MAPGEITCDHCERPYALKQLHPVIISGVQSYNGHLLTNKPEARRVPLCPDCYVNLKNAHIQGLTLMDDDDAIAAINAGTP
jgi:hypothetical protein